MFKSNEWPPLNALRGFEAAARLSSFSGAATELNMTQSAISHQVRTLEEHLEQELFQRINRRVILTDAGYDLLATVHKSLGLLSDGIKRLDHYKKPNQFIVHTSSAFASNWLVQRLQDFNRAAPKNDVWLYTTDAEPDLDLSEVDVAILHGDQKMPGFFTREILRDYLVPLCAPDHPLVSQRASRAPDYFEPDDLTSHTLLHSEQDATWRTWFSHMGNNELNPVSGPSFSNPSLMLDAAATGLGIALGSVVLAASDIINGKLICPFNLPLPAEEQFFFVCHDDDRELPSIAGFSDWLDKQVNQFDKIARRHNLPGADQGFALNKPRTV